MRKIKPEIRIENFWGKIDTNPDPTEAGQATD